MVVMSEKKRDGFTSGLGFVLAVMGSAIGLGNIWRFPHMTGSNGGGAFVLVYLLIVFLIGAPLLLTEFVIGRHGQKNAIDSYGAISSKFKWLGYLGAFTSFPLLAYYIVVGGWVLFYLVESLTGSLTALPGDQVGAFFGGFISRVNQPLVYTAVFMLMTFFIVVQGIAKGIEKWNKILMPLLFILLIILALRSMSLPGAFEGIKWYLTPDFSKIDGNTIIAALGQAFFSLSVGLCGMVTYGSYLSKKENLSRSVLIASAADTVVALLAGFVIFPALFSFGVTPTAGPVLIFITLPQVFAQMPLGAVWSVFFYILLLFASLTSAISVMELFITCAVEKLNISRTKASIGYSAIVFLLAIPVSLGYGIWSHITLFGKNFLEVYDYYCANISNPLTALMCSLLIGWVWGKKGAMEELTNNGMIDNVFTRAWFPIVKWIAPIAVGVIWLNAVGLLKL